MNPPGETLADTTRPGAAAPPRSRGRWKRPATGQLVQSFDRDELVIERWPEGRTRALVLAWVAGILGATLLVAVLSVLLLGRPRGVGSDWDLLGVVFVCWILATAVMTALARRSWRDLHLAAGPRGLRLVEGDRRRRWPRDRVSRIEVYETGRADRHVPVAELKIHLGDLTVLRLLGERDKGELDSLARFLRIAMWPPAESARAAPAELVEPAESADPGPLDAAPVPVLPLEHAPDAGPTDVAPPAIDRLVDLHRDLQAGKLKPGGGEEQEPPEDPVVLLDYAGRGRQRGRRHPQPAPVSSGPARVIPLAVPLADVAAGRANGVGGVGTTASGPTDRPSGKPSFGAVLDYAGPRPRGDSLRRTRLPAVSDLHVDVQHDGDVTLTETLRGREAAVFAIAFAVIVLVMVGFVASKLAADHQIGQACVLMVAFAAELTVLVLVVINTWRKTTLRVDRQGLTLTFRGLLRAARTHAFPAARVGELRVVRHDDTPRWTPAAAAPAELRVGIADGPQLHLFGGHSEAELTALARHLKGAMGQT